MVDLYGSFSLSVPYQFAFTQLALFSTCAILTRGVLGVPSTTCDTAHFICRWRGDAADRDVTEESSQRMLPLTFQAMALTIIATGPHDTNVHDSEYARGQCEGIVFALEMKSGRSSALAVASAAAVC